MKTTTTEMMAVITEQAAITAIEHHKAGWAIEEAVEAAAEHAAEQADEIGCPVPTAAEIRVRAAGIAMAEAALEARQASGEEREPEDEQWAHAEAAAEATAREWGCGR